MSRIGKRPITIPQGVDVQIQGRVLRVKGPKGELSYEVRPEIRVEKEGDSIQVRLADPSKKGREFLKAKALWGLTRTLAENMIHGVVHGYEKKLELEGVGYRAALEGRALVLSVGYSHPVRLEAPASISFAVDKSTISVTGISKEEVGEWAAKVRATRPVEPYKGKGIKYEGERVRRKEGKKAGT